MLKRYILHKKAKKKIIFFETTVKYFSIKIIICSLFISFELYIFIFNVEERISLKIIIKKMLKRHFTQEIF